MSRRSAITKLAGGAAVASAAATLTRRLAAAESAAPDLKGRINHSVCKWCYEKIPLETMCRAGKEMGLQSVELLTVDDFPTLREHGLICAMVSGVPGSITSGWNRLEHHDKIVEYFEATIPKVAEAGYPNMICFSGNREGMGDEEGLKNCAIGLKRVVGLAEKRNVTICMELLNSKVNHHDYMCDHTAWGVELCRQVGSDRFKLLYDIYHMQIMEGDVIRTIQDNHEYIAHYHTGGVPGRHEID
jgi:hydroxypyruvate isomerase